MPVTRSVVTAFVRHRLGAIVAVVVLFGSLSACTRAGAGRSPVAQPARASASTAPTVRVPAWTSPPAWSPAAAPPTRSLPPRFLGEVWPLPAGLAAEMRGRTWQPGCPVPLRELRLLTLRYWGFDGQVHQGPMVVNQAVAGQVLSVFRRLFQARFPIQQLHLAGRPRTAAALRQGMRPR